MSGAGAQRARVSLAPEEGALDKLDRRDEMGYQSEICDLVR